MQLGARWSAGSPPHRSVPAALHTSIVEQEAAHPGASAWTITWLEGRPRCALDDVAYVRIDAHGEVVTSAVTKDGADTDSALEAGSADRGSAGCADDSDDSDDDDWLR